MLKKFNEADFIALRGPFESGRQSPKNLSFNLIIAIPLNMLLVTLIYLIFGQDEILPYQFAIFIGHVTISVLLIICSLIFVIPAYMSIDTNSIVLLLVGPVIYYFCIFVLPEQLVLLYCKFRFESFNFDKDGNLHLTDVLIEDDENEIQR